MLPQQYWWCFEEDQTFQKCWFNEPDTWPQMWPFGFEIELLINMADRNRKTIMPQIYHTYMHATWFFCLFDLDKYFKYLRYPNIWSFDQW